jgi:hypothetical protein
MVLITIPSRTPIELVQANRSGMHRHRKKQILFSQPTGREYENDKEYVKGYVYLI